jgi:DNA-directed RNA polymerase subunit RPC12/RpoP
MLATLDDEREGSSQDEATLERLEALHEHDVRRRERTASAVITPRCPRCGHELIARPRGRDVAYPCACVSPPRDQVHRIPGIIRAMP